MAVLFDEDDAGPFKCALDYLKVARPPASGPLPGDLKHEEYVAAKILNENATGRDEGGKDAARDLPDRTRTTKEVNLIRLLPVWFWRSPHNPYARDKGRAEAGPPTGPLSRPDQRLLLGARPRAILSGFTSTRQIAPSSWASTRSRMGSSKIKPPPTGDGNPSPSS
jgi:hypothetical protein